MSLSLKIYHKLPGWSRNLAASLRGHYLNSWRYDKNSQILVEQALERDFWGRKDWDRWVGNRLDKLLSRARTSVPYYREVWDERSDDLQSSDKLENWQILEKDSVRKEAENLVADDRNLKKMFCDHTSGTTGTALNIWASSDTVKHWYALNEARCRNWYGVTKNDRWAILGGQLVTPATQTKPPFWVWNSAMNQLYLSSYHLSLTSVKSYLDALCRYRVRYILGYPSAIYTLARSALALGRRDVTLHVAISNAEPLYDHQRETIAEAFDCAVRETYGMAEMAAAATECSEGNLHQWLDAGIIETDDNDEIICTGLVNPDMPLIRYRVGDRAKFAKTPCACGRSLPVIASIEGRSDDVLLTPDGRIVGRLDPVFKKDMPVIESQIIQKTLKTILVKYVPAPDFNSSAGRDLSNRIRERLGDVEVILEKVSQIPRTPRGKFRAVVCELSAEERTKARGF
ncbi:MAG: phenylacetate--CoA ligase family protein [Pyrinomonadaceae bacterium]|nr:phenylacetate--CoA ligase family protein [Pyrinomonadaceae bacterium]